MSTGYIFIILFVGFAIGYFLGAFLALVFERHKRCDNCHHFKRTKGNAGKCQISPYGEVLHECSDKCYLFADKKKELHKICGNCKLFRDDLVSFHGQKCMRFTTQENPACRKFFPYNKD